MPIKFNEVTWYSKWLAVILFIIIIPILTFYIGREYQKTVYIVENNSTYISQDELEHVSKISSDPLNDTYIIDDQEISLVNGVAKSGRMETRVFGEVVKADLNNDNKTDSIFFISQETGGTGVFFFVAVSVDSKGTETVFIGDRIAPQNIKIDNGVIAVNYATRKENEPMSATPSVGVTKYFTYQNGELVEKKETKDVFQSSPRPNNQSQVVGYFSHGAFVFNALPDWIVENWKNENKGADILVFSPREEILDRDFSDIVMETGTTTEQFNAGYLYEKYGASLGMNSGRLMISEIFLNTVGDTRIYHIQRLYGTGLEDTFYIDGNGKTVIITFKSNPQNYAKYGAKIKEFVQGIGKGEAPRG